MVMVVCQLEAIGRVVVVAAAVCDLSFSVVFLSFVFSVCCEFERW